MSIKDNKNKSKILVCIDFMCAPIRDNLIPRVLGLFGQWLVARGDLGVLEVFHRRISAVKQRLLLEWILQNKIGHLMIFTQQNYYFKLDSKRNLPA